ncbi:MAG: ankyrin repeat domain-containing protein [Candidatus Obscuribacterales bacterium]|nr:ankyrin repeat domain-containing protein [Cyanobacteria bacterium HKST-UBA01]MCB9469388.1 ankyrin repeat domain-containing protein [Candidatus Obscuribacterales bacterium]
MPKNKDVTTGSRFTEALNAIRAGETENLSSILAKNPPLAEELDQEGKYKLLHYLALPHQGKFPSKEAESLKILLADSSRISEEDRKKLLQLAAANGRELLLRACLEAGINADTETLHAALDAGETALAKTLCNDAVEMDFLSAAGLGDIDALASYFDGSNNLRLADDQVIDFGTLAMTRALVEPLIVACKNGQMEAAFFLIKKGADLNYFEVNEGKDRKVNLEASGLHWASRYGHYELVKFLINYGARIQSRDTLEDKTPAQWAEEAGHENIRLYLNHLSGSGK